MATALQKRSYTAPSGPGKWEPTPPSYAKASTAHIGKPAQCKGSIDNTQPPAPPPYSEILTGFYKMVNEVYVVDRNLSAEQKTLRCSGGM